MDTPQNQIVYIIDDDASVRRGLSRLMRSAGRETEEFASAAEFLQNPNQEDLGCILLDISMPAQSGLQLKAELNRLGVTLPVIAISARDDADTRSLAKSLGVKAFFRKPVDDQALLDSIDWALSSPSS